MLYFPTQPLILKLIKQVFLHQYNDSFIDPGFMRLLEDTDYTGNWSSWGCKLLAVEVKPILKRRKH